jgi:hypothetical protein
MKKVMLILLAFVVQTTSAQLTKDLGEVLSKYMID